MSAVTLPLTHEQYQRQITELAQILHWRVLHVRKSIGGKKQGWRTTTSIIGWCDLWLWHDDYGFVGIEVKVGKDKPTPEQLEVLASLARAGARTLVAYPADFDVVVNVLKGLQ